MAINRLHVFSLLAIAALMPVSVIEANQVSIVYRMCDPGVLNKMTFTSNVLSIIIRSMNYGSGSYLSNLNCSFHLDSGHEPLVLLFEFKKFDVEYSRSCSFDFLCVSGVKFCGKYSKGKNFRQVLPPYSRSTIIFRTDTSRQYSGFEIIVSGRKAIENEIVLEPVGIGSRAENLSYVNVTYNSWMHYEDRCLMPPGRFTTTKPRTTTTEPPTTTTEPPTTTKEPPTTTTKPPTTTTKPPTTTTKPPTTTTEPPTTTTKPPTTTTKPPTTTTKPPTTTTKPPTTTTKPPTTTKEPPTTTKEPPTTTAEPPLELPLNITVLPTSATNKPFDCNCKCTCPHRPKRHNYYTKPGAGKYNGF